MARASIAFRFTGLNLAGSFLMAGRPERMFLAAVLIRIALGRNLLPRGALDFLERIWIGGHDLGFLAELDFAFLSAGILADVLASVLASDALLGSASVRATGMPCFLSRSANASSASSCMVAIRSRLSCFSL